MRPQTDFIPSFLPGGQSVDLPAASVSDIPGGMTAPPAVSVVIAAYHSADYISRCLESLALQTYKDFEVIVVNSSRETRTGEVVSGFPGVRFHQHTERLLPHAARNLGAEMARSGLLVFTDADCRAEPGWLEALVRCHGEGHPYLSGGIETESRRWISKAIHLLKYSPYLRGRAAGPIRVAATGNISITRETWDRIGPFDGTVFSGDALLSWKARMAGFAPWFEPGAVVFDQDEAYRRGFLRERFRRGMEFGRLRADFLRWGGLELAARSLLMPLALFSALLSMASNCRKAGRLRDFLWTLPFQALAQGAWCIGEAVGYLRLLFARRQDE